MSPPCTARGRRTRSWGGGAGASPARVSGGMGENSGNGRGPARHPDAFLLGAGAAGRALPDGANWVEVRPPPPLRADGSYALVTLAGRTEAPVLQAVRATIDQWMRD